MVRIRPATVINDPRPKAPRTFVVAGQGRGGTSMLTGVLLHLGVPISVFWPADWQTEEYPYHEDARINVALGEDDLETFTSIARENDAAHEVWGYKHIYSPRLLPFASQILRNPHYLVPMRALSAVAQREQAFRPEVPWPEIWSQTVAGQAVLAEFVATTPCPLLLVSYERALWAPEELVRQVAKFCGWKPTHGQFLAAIQSIRRPGDPR